MINFHSDHITILDSILNGTKLDNNVKATRELQELSCTNSISKNTNDKTYWKRRTRVIFTYPT